jgi:hypothetical protein
MNVIDDIHPHDIQSNDEHDVVQSNFSASYAPSEVIQIIETEPVVAVSQQQEQRHHHQMRNFDDDRGRRSVDIPRRSVKVHDNVRRHSISIEHGISERIRENNRRKKSRDQVVGDMVNVIQEPSEEEMSVEYFRDKWTTPAINNSTEEPPSPGRLARFKSALRRESISKPPVTVALGSSSFNAETVEPISDVDQQVHSYFRRPSLFAVVSDESANSSLAIMSQNEVDTTVPRFLQPTQQETEDKKKKKQHLLNGFDGVFVPCVAATIGTILFLKIPWILAEAGTGYTLLYVVISVLIALLTWTSMSAIVTNGFIPHGGPVRMMCLI